MAKAEKAAPAAPATDGTPRRTGQCPSCKSPNVSLKDVNGIFVCERCSTKKFSSKVRKQIEEAFARQEEVRRKKAWKYRISVAKRGVAYFQKGFALEALKAFRDYLGILEFHHNVEPDGLQPTFFDAQKDAGELLLIAGIYWDMAKIHDHIKGHSRQTRQSLNKFMEFSVDKPHCIIASEAVRKYLKTGQVVNKTDFSEAHAFLRMHLAKCFVASFAFETNAAPVNVLRSFRDLRLAKSKIGQAFIAFYYRTSPAVVRLLWLVPGARAVLRLLLTPLIWFARRTLQA